MPSSYITTSNKLKIAELDFDAIKATLIEYLQGQDEFKDYDFTGSAMNILLDILSYNTHYNGFYANMIASEMFMDSASLRSSVVSLAKHLGYTPASRKGASVDLDIVFVGEGLGTSVLIPKGAKFSARLGTNIYTFLTTVSRVATEISSVGPTYSATNVTIKEGVAFSSTQVVLGTTNELFRIPNENIDIDTLDVSVAGEVHQLADDITEIVSESKVYFLQEGSENQYEIYFGNGIIGKKPDTGSVVQINYNVSMLGEEGNGSKTFVFAESLAENVSVTLSAGHIRSAGGSEREETSSIRIQAPRQYALQKRVVTVNDYKTRLEKDFNIVESVRVWGGEEHDPPEYGKVFISVKPKTGYVLSLAEIDRIRNEILKKRNMVTIKPKFIPPDYLFVVIDTTIAYDPRKTNQTADQLRALVTSTILDFSSVNLGKFDEYFRHSVLSRSIDDTEVSITNNNTIIALKKRIKPILQVDGFYDIHFDNPIHRPEVGHRNVLQSTLFNYRGIPNCTIVDGDGVLFVVSSDGGIINGNVGLLDYETGDVILTSFRPLSISDGSEYIYFAIKPRINDIIPRRNTIITIESSDITVNAIDDTDRIAENRTRGY